MLSHCYVESRRGWVPLRIAILAAGIFLLSNATYAAKCTDARGGGLVTVDASDYDNSGIVYTVGGVKGRCLWVQAKDVLTWTVKTSKTHHRMMIYIPASKTPFQDKNNQDVHVLQGSESDEHVGSSNIGKDLHIGDADLTSKFSVLVWDVDSGETFADDPKIIVGRGFNAEQQLEKADARLNDLLNGNYDPEKFKVGVEEVENCLKDILKELQEN